MNKHPLLVMFFLLNFLSNTFIDNYWKLCCDWVGLGWVAVKKSYIIQTEWMSEIMNLFKLWFYLFLSNCDLQNVQNNSLIYNVYSM